MDRVRLGRALGYGTRHAARTVAAIAEAASATRPAAGPGAGPAPAGGEPRTRRSEPEVQRRPRVAIVTPQNLGQGVGHFKRSFWAPLATFSGALWLRVTGLFFFLIAFAMAGGAWRLRGSVRLGTMTAEAPRFCLFFGFMVLFGYFAVSSFVRAALRERRAANNAG